MHNKPRPDNWEYDNEESKFWKYSYEVYLHEFDNIGYFINADNEQDALDAAIDLAEEEGLMGLFIENPTEEDYETMTVGGNHGLVLSSENWRIEKVSDPIVEIKTQEEYLEEGGTECPVCGCDDISGSGLDFIGANVITQEVECNKCGSVWIEEYHCTGFSMI